MIIDVVVVSGGVMSFFSGVTAAIVAEKKEAGFLWQVALFIGGFIGLMLALTMDWRQKCPECLNRVPSGAKLCGHCRSRLVWPGGHVLPAEGYQRRQDEEKELWRRANEAGTAVSTNGVEITTARRH